MPYDTSKLFVVGWSFNGLDALQMVTLLRAQVSSRHDALNVTP